MTPRVAVAEDLRRLGVALMVIALVADLLRDGWVTALAFVIAIAGLGLAFAGYYMLHLDGDAKS